MNDTIRFLNGMGGAVIALATFLGAVASMCVAIIRLKTFFPGRKVQPPSGPPEESNATGPAPRRSPAPQNKWKRKIKRAMPAIRFAILSAILLAVTVVLGIILLEPPPPLTRSELLTRAWAAYNREDWDHVVELTTNLYDKLEWAANKKQKELLETEVPFPQTGRLGVDLTDADVKRNNSFGLINDVATALYLRGEAQKHLGKMEQAHADWEKVKTYEHAVTFDLQTQEFWRTSDAASNGLCQLDKVKVK